MNNSHQSKIQFRPCSELKSLFSFFLMICTISSIAQNGALADSTPKTYPKTINFIVMGDWGVMGQGNQIPMANQIAKTAADIDRDFIITTGDNFYPKGVQSEFDPQWQSSFEDVYKAFSLQWEWYPVLGNHDYLGNPDAEVAYSKISRRWQMPARYYSKTFAIAGDTKNQVLIAFIDTNPMIPEFYPNKSYAHSVLNQDSTAQKLWLEKTLSNKSPNIKWKIVVGHHPLYTATLKRRESNDTRAVRSSLKSIFDKYKVDAYLCGHDHSLQHLTPPGTTQYFVSGSASQFTAVDTLPFSKLALADYGFMAFSIGPKNLNVQVINQFGKVVYRTEIIK